MSGFTRRIARLGGLRRKRRRRGRLARVRQVGLAPLRQPFAGGQEPAIPGRPIRARPQKIEFIEEYHYHVRVERHPLFSGRPTKLVGEIQILLPCDKMGREAILDAARNEGMAGADTMVRYGWLGLSNIRNSDLVARLREARPWKEPAFRAFPLAFPILTEDFEVLEDAIEGGMWAWTQFYYRPAAPVPFPFEFRLMLGRDAAVPTSVPPSDAEEHYRLESPDGASGQSVVLHFSFSFKLTCPEGIAREEVEVKVGRMHINWPVPVVADELSLLGTSEGTLSVDERYKQVVIENVPARIEWSEGGPLRAHTSFRLAVHHPATLRGMRHFGGRTRFDVRGFNLSGVQAYFFDAAGYLQTENCDGAPLISHRNEIHADWEYWIEESHHCAPVLMQRRYTWPAAQNVPSPFQEVERVLYEQGFRLLEEYSFREENTGCRWWATRSIDGKELTIDLLMQQQGQTAPVPSPVPAGAHPSNSATLARRVLYDLDLRLYYDGRREAATEQLRWLEERLRQRLDLRRKEL